MKTLSMMVLLLMTSTALFAQSGKDSDLGFYLGPNFSRIDVESPDLTAENKTGFQAGVFYRRGGFLYGQAGLEYFKLQTNLVTGNHSGAVDIKQLHVPLYAGLNLLNFSKNVVNLRVYAGPSVYYTLNAPSYNPEFSTGDFNRFGVNGVMGAGLDVLIFSLDAGYTMGVSNLFEGDWEAKGNYAYVNVGLKF